MSKTCSKCKADKGLADFYKDKGGKFGVRSICKGCDISRRIVFRNNNREQHRITKRKRDNIRRAIDPLYNLRRATSRTITAAVRKKGFKKKSNSEKILGCSWVEFKIHLESQFQPEMSWDNYGKWEIDHIIPCASATTEEELLKLQHYTNLQPLWWKENNFKRAKIL